jgi:hypothetical protein
MNETLSRIRAIAHAEASSRDARRRSSSASLKRRHEAARPLLQAFSDIQNEYVKVDVLRRIWPEDFERRDDRLAGLVTALLGTERYPCGIRIRLPGGYRSFEVEESWDGELRYINARETEGARPSIVQFGDVEAWMESFYQSMAVLLDV